MKINELVARLQAIAFEHGGDVEVWASDDTDEVGPITAIEPPTQYTAWAMVSS